MNDLVKVSTAQLDNILNQISSASALTDLTEVRARIEAARAWSKVHGQVKEMRLDLLRVEVEALVRVVELGGLDTLPAKDRKAARHLANMTVEDRALLVAQSGTATTATGMVRSLWQAEELQVEREANRRMGHHLATHPDIATDEQLRADVKRSTFAIQDVLGQILDDFTTDGEEFTVGELASNVMAAAAIGDTASDPEVERGIQQVCRDAIRRQPVVKVENTVLPRIITALSEAGNHVRIPVENALLAHLDQMIELRREQVRQDQAALDELIAVATRLRSIPGAADDSRIGSLIAATLTQSQAGAA